MNVKHRDYQEDYDPVHDPHIPRLVGWTLAIITGLILWGLIVWTVAGIYAS